MEADAGGGDLFRICLLVLGGVRAGRFDAQSVCRPVHAAVGVRLLFSFILVSIGSGGLGYRPGAGYGVGLGSAWAARAVQSCKICPGLAVRRTVLPFPGARGEAGAERRRNDGQSPVARNL